MKHYLFICTFAAPLFLFTINFLNGNRPEQSQYSIMIDSISNELNISPAVNEIVCKKISGELSKTDQVIQQRYNDQYRITVKRPTHIILTFSSMSLLCGMQVRKGPGDGNIVGQCWVRDPQQKNSWKEKLELPELQAGDYYLHVFSYKELNTGSYEIIMEMAGSEMIKQKSAAGACENLKTLQKHWPSEFRFLRDKDKIIDNSYGAAARVYGSQFKVFSGDDFGTIESSLSAKHKFRQTIKKSDNLELIKKDYNTFSKQLKQCLGDSWKFEENLMDEYPRLFCTPKKARSNCNGAKEEQLILGVKVNFIDGKKEYELELLY